MNQGEPDTGSGEWLTEEEWQEHQDMRRATRAHVLPFLFWIGCIFLVGQFAIESDDIIRAWVYSVQTVVGLGLMLYLRPWRWYAAPVARNVPLALLVGVAVFVVWVLPETDWVGRLAPGFRETYLRYFVLPPWSVTAPPETSPFAPQVAGWGLTLMRLIGSAFVIAVIEEYFWRGWLYRWLLARNFLKVDLGRWDTGMFIATCAVFAVEHMQWAVGFLAGVAYLWLMIRTRDLWAAILAHVVTNFLLGVYVIVFDKYEFW
jgi:uncharacterized protein